MLDELVSNGASVTLITELMTMIGGHTLHRPLPANLKAVAPAHIPSTARLNEAPLEHCETHSRTVIAHLGGLDGVEDAPPVNGLGDGLEGRVSCRSRFRRLTALAGSARASVCLATRPRSLSIETASVSAGRIQPRAHRICRTGSGVTSACRPRKKYEAWDVTAGHYRPVQKSCQRNWPSTWTRGMASRGR